MMTATTTGVVRSCDACGAKNRIHAKHLADTGRCGRCKAPLAALAAPIDVDPELFAEIASESPLPILVLKKGQVVWQQAGMRGADELERQLAAAQTA